MFPVVEEPARPVSKRPPMGLLYRVRSGSGKFLEGGLGLGDGHIHLPVLDGHDHVPVLVVAEYPGAGPVETLQSLGGGVPVWVVRPDLDDGYLRGKAAEKEGRRGGAGAVMGNFQDRLRPRVGPVRHVLFLLSLGCYLVQKPS